MKVIATTSGARWISLTMYTLAVLHLGRTLTTGLVINGQWIKLNPFDRTIWQSLVAIAWAPLAWNVIPRLEYRHRILSRLTFGNRAIAQGAFALYIVLFSAFRERLFFRAIATNESLVVKDAFTGVVLLRLGDIVLLTGVVLSLTGFYHLRVRFTYMGEYFGFRMTRLITAFPYSFCSDPMYTGCVLMHFGYALRVNSPVGFFLAAVTALSYWIAAKIFEEPFMIYCYSGMADRDV